MRRARMALALFEKWSREDIDELCDCCACWPMA
jgi:ketosteroid isomerase-like protein